MEESKELQGMYKMFRTFIYISLLLEFFVFALDQSLINHFWGFVQNLHAIFGKMGLYQNLIYSKLGTLLLIAITSIGTRNKKNLEFNARKMVFWPIVFGFTMFIARTGTSRLLGFSLIYGYI